MKTQARILVAVLGSVACLSLLSTVAAADPSAASQRPGSGQLPPGEIIPSDIYERAKTDKSWQRAVAPGWTIRTFPGTHVAMTEDPRGVATLIEQSVSDLNKPAQKAN